VATTYNTLLTSLQIERMEPGELRDAEGWLRVELRHAILVKDEAAKKRARLESEAREASYEGEAAQRRAEEIGNLLATAERLRKKAAS